MVQAPCPRYGCWRSPVRYLEQMLIGPLFASSAKPEELCDIPAHKLGQGRDMVWLRGPGLRSLSPSLENHWGLQRRGSDYTTHRLQDESPLWCPGPTMTAVCGSCHPRPELSSCLCFCLCSWPSEFYKERASSGA